MIFYLEIRVSSFGKLTIFDVRDNLYLQDSYNENLFIKSHLSNYENSVRYPKCLAPILAWQATFSQPHILVVYFYKYVAGVFVYNAS